MQDNLNSSVGNSRVPHNQNEAELGVLHNAVIAQPQRFKRTYNELINCVPTSTRNSDNSRKVMHYTGAYEQSNGPWLKMPHYSDLDSFNETINVTSNSNFASVVQDSVGLIKKRGLDNVRIKKKIELIKDQNTRSNSSESVTINFDNISESATSNSVNLYEQYACKISLEPDEQNVAALESERSHQNLSNHIRDINIDIALHNNNNFGDQISSNSNQDDPSVTQNSGETQRENTNQRNQSVEKIFNKYIPFITFLSLKAIYDHREGILIFLGLLVTFIHANSVVKREIAKQSRRSVISLGIIFVNLFVSICFIFFVFQEQELYKRLLFIPPYSQPLSVWDVLWIVGITDFVLKFITIQIKVGMTCFPPKLLPYSARGKWYLTLECASQLYRSLTPIQPWLYYLMEVYQGSEKVIGMLFSVAYVVSKGSDILSKIKLFSKAFWKLLHNVSLGVHPSNEQLVTAGSQCPICHDEYTSPIILQCKHIFCESCVSTWFDREQTCPLCRAKIADDPTWRDGATSLFTQLF